MAPKLIKPRFLFISPVLPSPDGPGLAMRTYYQIVNLSQIYSIHLLVAGTTPEKPVYDGDIKNCCENIDYICRYRFSGWTFSLWHRSCRLMDKLRHFVRGDDLTFAVDSGDKYYLQHDKTLAMIASMKFDRVHVFRIYLTSLAETLKKQELNSFYSLDIDDIESATRRSISKLFFANGDFIQASKLSKESEIYFNIETKSIPGYDQTFTCSQHDRNILQSRFPDKVISVLPNVVPIPKKTRNHRANQIFTILFVGTLGYYPNTDALLFFADQIAPILREKSRQPWILRVVGAFPENKWIKRLESFPEIKFAGWMKDISQEYETADVVVAPIRGGGGTRIKILEAFAHGVPVVSTSKGCEGLDVANRVHLIIEDDARRFAEACIQLMTDNRFADKISRQALDLVVLKYSPEIINQVWTSQLPHTGLN
jgi:glycosyltransferase involved in cell wall biosynthesis